VQHTQGAPRAVSAPDSERAVSVKFSNTSKSSLNLSHPHYFFCLCQSLLKDRPTEAVAVKWDMVVADDAPTELGALRKRSYVY